jgi:hypothetical protein
MLTMRLSQPYFSDAVSKRRDPQIVVCRLDHLAAGDAVEHILRAVAHAAVGHANDVLVVSLEHDAHVEHPRSIPGSDRLPIASAGQQGAAQTLAFKTAAGYNADASVDARRVADIDRRLNIEQQDEQGAHTQLRHFSR